MKKFILLLTACLFINNVTAQEKNQIIKTGYNFGPLPVIAFDQDRGFQYGALLNIFYFGDGSTYPNPKQQWYIEASAYTKGSQNYVVSYDNRSLIPGVRFSAAVNVTREKALDFYGFNGYQSYYDKTIPTGYYKMGRLRPYAKIDFTGKILPGFYWKAGYHFQWFKLSNFESDSLEPQALGYNTFFELYKGTGLIPEEDANGGRVSSVRFGLMYDNRDVENSPTKGIWAEVNGEYAPQWLGTSKGFFRYQATIRGYYPFFSKRLVAAARTTIEGYAGSPAFYVLPYTMVTGNLYDRDGFGGYRTVRGMLRDRLQAKSVFYYNTELRYRFLDFKLIKQNFSLCFSVFHDGALSVQPYEIPGLMPNHVGKYCEKDGWHGTAGAGLRLMMNRNFIIAFEYGAAFNRQDNKFGSFYINTGFLF